MNGNDQKLNNHAWVYEYFLIITRSNVRQLSLHASMCLPSSRTRQQSHGTLIRLFSPFQPANQQLSSGNTFSFFVLQQARRETMLLYFPIVLLLWNSSPSPSLLRNKPYKTDLIRYATMNSNTASTTAPGSNPRKRHEEDPGAANNSKKPRRRNNNNKNGNGDGAMNSNNNNSNAPNANGDGSNGNRNRTRNRNNRNNNKKGKNSTENGNGNAPEKMDVEAAAPEVANATTPSTDGKSRHQFSDLKFTSIESISASSKRALTEVLQYEYMTKVQEATLPSILDSKDVVAKAKTGRYVV
jgi:hypothetical protein